MISGSELETTSVGSSSGSSSSSTISFTTVPRRPSWDMAIGLLVEEEEQDFDEHLAAYFRDVHGRDDGGGWLPDVVPHDLADKVDFTNTGKMRLWKALMFLEIMSKRCVRWSKPTEYWWDGGGQ